MIKIRNYEVYAAPKPFPETSVGAAIADLLSQRLNHKVFMRLDKITQAAEAQANSIEKAHKHILDQYKRGADGKFTESDLVAISLQYNELLNDTFEIDQTPLTLDEIAGFDLIGWTRKSSIIEKPAEPEEVSATDEPGTDVE